ARVVALDRIERQGPDVQLFAIRWPGDAGIVCRIARLPHDDDEAPLQRLAVNLCDERVEKIVLVLRRRSSAGLFERLYRLQGPAYRGRNAGRIDEAKRIQTVERGVAKPRWNRLLSNDLEHPHGFGMPGEKLLHFGWVEFSRGRVGLARDHLLVEALRRANG